MPERTLLIVDDEYWIRRHLAHAFDWAQFGVTRVLEAENGEAAKRLLETENPDVLLTDMDMPYMDGLELIRCVREEHPHVMVLVLSGYSRFELVRGALANGAVDYLLKPVDKPSLYAAMEKLIRMDDERRMRERADRDLQFAGLLREDDASLAAALGLTGEWRLLVCQYHLNRDRSPEEIRALLTQCFPARPVFVNPWMRGEAFAVLSARSQPVEFADALNESGAVAWASVLCSRVSTDGGDVRRTYRLLSERFGLLPLTRETVRCFADDGRALPAPKPRLPEEALRRLAGLIQSGDTDGADGLMRRTFSMDALTAGGWLYDELATALTQCARTLRQAAQRKGCPLDTLLSMRTLQEDLESILRHHGIAGTLPLLSQMAALTAAEAENEESLSPLEEVRVWLDDHFTGDVSLTALSEQFHLSPSYLSRAFKKEFGENLIAYVTAKRMKLAEELLTRGESALSDVAYLAGYDDYSYFSNVFRRCYGCSPSAYQNKAKNHE